MYICKLNHVLHCFPSQAQAFQMQHLKSLEAQRLQQIHAAPSVPQVHHHPPAPTLQLQQQLHHLTPQVQAPVRAATNIPANGTGFQVDIAWDEVIGLTFDFSPSWLNSLLTCSKCLTSLILQHFKPNDATPAASFVHFAPFLLSHCPFLFFQHLNFHPPPPPSAFMTVSSAGTGSQLDPTASEIFSSPPLPHPQMG